MFPPSGNEDISEEEDVCDVQFQTVFSPGGDAGSYVPELM